MASALIEEDILSGVKELLSEIESSKEGNKVVDAVSEYECGERKRDD